jgi:ribonuclease Z
MQNEINELSQLAYEGSSMPLTSSPVIGTPKRAYAEVLAPGTEPLGPDEVRVTVLGSGDPFVKKGQAAASILIEVGNPDGDLFFFDIGSGALANFNGLGLPVTSTTKVFLSHLHAGHVGDMPTLMWSLAKSGRRDPVEVWGPAGEHERFGVHAYTRHLEMAHAWDMQSMCGHLGQSGARAVTTEVPYDHPQVVYQRSGVTVTSFPAIHAQNGAVGYRLDYGGRSVVFSGDTRPCRYLIDACDGVDLLIHETFPAASVFAKKAGVSLGVAETIVNGAHTSPAMAGIVFARSRARMSAMWHLAVDHETVGPVFEEMREQYSGPVVISQDLTVFDITKESVITRQRTVDPFSWPIVGEPYQSGPPISQPLGFPAWWADALVTD